MDEFRARRVVDALRDRGVNAHLLRGGVGQFGIRVSLPGGREAEWDTDGTAGLEAQVMRDGMLVGYVPQIEGSEDFDESKIVDAIASTDYDQPVARQRTVTSAPPLPEKAASSAVSSTASATGNQAPPDGSARCSRHALHGLADQPERLALSAAYLRGEPLDQRPRVSRMPLPAARSCERPQRESDCPSGDRPEQAQQA